LGAGLSFIPGIGQILGPIVGALGPLISGLFGGQQNNYPKAAAYFGTSGGLLTGAGGVGVANGGTQFVGPVKALRDQISGQVNALLGSLGGSLGTGGLGYFGPGGIGGVQIKNGNFNTVIGGKVESFGQNQQAAIENAVVEILSQSISKGLVGGISDNVAKAIKSGGNYDTIAQLTKDINLGRLADGLSALSDSTISFEGDLQKLQSDFTETKKRAADLGFQIGDKLQQQFDDAKAGLEQKYFGQFRDFATALKGGSLSTASPEQKFFDARTAYNDIARKALAGDATAQGQFIGAAQTYLGLAQQQFASTGSYATIYNDVLATTNKLGTAPDVSAPVVNAVTSGSAAVVAAIKENTQVQKDAIAENRALRMQLAAGGKR
jgi:hypothetical protein